ncbi:MAG: hypothetical protein RLZZ93_264, partial [Actinomycetota bacterium]
MPLVLVLVVNAAVYVLLVRPLVERVTNVEQRTATAEQTLAAARGEHAQASG